MDLRRLALAGILLLFAITALGLNCGGPPKTPGKPFGPAEAYQRASVSFKVSTTAPGDPDLRYVMEWGDGVTDTTRSGYGSGDTVIVRHRYLDVGTYSLKVLAIVEEEPEKASDWSEPASINILPNGAPGVPVPDPDNPNGTAVRAWTFFRAKSEDPDGDDVALMWSFGDWSDYVPGGTWLVDSVRFTKIETTEIFCIAKDVKGSESETLWVRPFIVGEAGAVLDWWYSDPEEEGIALLAPVVATWEGNELIYTGADYPNDYIGFMIDGESWKVKKKGSPVVPSEENIFISGGAYVQSKGVHIVGNEDGELYGFNGGLDDLWRYPNKEADPDSLSYIPWGSPAVAGSRVYCTRDNDSIYWLNADFTTVEMKGAYYIPFVSDVCVVDNNGNVIVSSASGNLYKFNPDLGLLEGWPKLLREAEALFWPALDSDGTIYVGGESGRLFARNADGTEKWTKELGTGEVYGIAVGTDAVYASTGVGKVYALDKGDGSEKWSREVTDGELFGVPLLASNGVMYVVDDIDKLFCLNMADGTLNWICNCELAGPGKRRVGAGRRIDDHIPSLAIDGNGDIIVVGLSALYLVAGYDDGKLATSAPWPKWQRDAYNRGSMVVW